MKERYVDHIQHHIQKNQLNFIPRNYNWYFFAILLLSLLIIGSVSGLLFVNLEILENYVEYIFLHQTIKILLVLTMICPVIILIFIFKRFQRIIFATEFQNMVFSNCVKGLCSFYIVCTNNGNIFYKSEKATKALKNKNNIIHIFGAQHTEQILKSDTGYEFLFEKHTLSSIKIARPEGYCLIRAEYNKPLNIYGELIERSGICTYSIKNRELIDCNQNYSEYIKRKATNPILFEKSSVIYNNLEHYILVPKILQLNDILAKIPLPVAIFDRDLQIIDFNNKFREATGIEDKINLKSALKNAFHLNNDQDIAIAELLFKNDNNTKAYIAKLENIFIGVFTDFNAIKDLEKRLEHSQKVSSIGRLTGSIAHDFNNILTAILGFCEILLSEIGEESKYYFDIYQIKNSAEKGSNLVKKLLAFARKQKLKEEVVNINEIIESLRSITNRLTYKNIEIEYFLSSNLNLVKIDASQFEQVLINLIINARDSIKEKGKIIIKTCNIIINSKIYALKNTDYREIILKGEYIRLKIKDTGQGISNEILPSIFDPFFSTKEANGSGLGLSTVYGIIKQFKGYIDVTSEENNGTEFNILIPVCHEEITQHKMIAQQAPITQSNRDANRAKTIMLIEDEQIVKNFLVKMLKIEGFNIIECVDFKLAERVFKDNKIDLIITDVVLPESSGPEIIEKIAKIQNNVKVIFISGYTKEKLQLEKLQDGWFFLEKPFKRQDLLDKISLSFQENIN